MSRTEIDAELTRRRMIGRWGTVARLAVGVAFVVVAFFVGMGWQYAALGLIGFPALVLVLLAFRGRVAVPLRLTGVTGHALNCGTIFLAFIVSAPAAFLFYGASMLLAAWRGYGGCEVFALSNWLMRRDDQIGCPLFSPIDAAEGRSGL